MCRDVAMTFSEECWTSCVFLFSLPELDFELFEKTMLVVYKKFRLLLADLLRN